MKTVVIGGGILGAALACRLAEAGQRVSVIDGTGPAATPMSFGWVNASFHLDEAHFRLRDEGLAAWRRLGALPGLSWPGALSVEPEAEGQAAALEALGYPVRRVGANAIRSLVPGLGSVPDSAVFFPEEGALDPQHGAVALLARAQAAGALLFSGVRVQAITETAGRVRAVQTEHGPIEADAVVVAAGIGAPDLVAPLGLHLPMLPRPGVLLVSQPLPRLSETILITPAREIRQDAAGRLIVPGAVAHQGDDSESLPQGIEAIADTARLACERIFPYDVIRWAHMGAAHRPVPGDKRPVIGAAGPEGLYLAVMHSGVTLAAVVAEALAAMLAGQSRHADLIAPYSPSRFQV